MLKKSQVVPPVIVEKTFQFEFDVNDTVHTITAIGVDENHALTRVYDNIDAIELDILEAMKEVEVVSEIKVSPKVINKKATPKKVVELKETPVNVSNGIVFNQPKKVNDPGFQPKFREEIN